MEKRSRICSSINRSPGTSWPERISSRNCRVVTSTRLGA